MQSSLDDEYAGVLENLSLTQFTTMQLETIEKAKTQANLILLAPTGSGKTLAFLIPIMSRLQKTDRRTQALIVAPSRELSLQIEQVFRAMKTGYKVCCCYGGHSRKTEQDSLSESPTLIIGTPGRLADHISRGSIDSTGIKIVVLDEFDKSLQAGFHEELKVVFRGLDDQRQYILTSATPLGPLPDFLPFKKPETLNYLKEAGLSKLKLALIHTKSINKVDTLMRLVAGFNQEPCLVFCNHREAVERISLLFRSHRFDHGILHGAMEQIDREKSLIRFRGGAHNVLIATDLASRGLDIPEIRHIVHYQLPMQEEGFLHRNGRTARMHASGDAYLILADDEILPAYIDKSVEELKLSGRLLLPPPPVYVCLYISAGKKDKISKGDIVGLFTKKGGLGAEDVGLIATLDHSSYVSVKRERVAKVLLGIKNQKLKNIKVKVELAT